jgi:hypothetical protein
VIDYLPIYDFEAVITDAAPGKVSVTIEAQTRDDFAGAG